MSVSISLTDEEQRLASRYAHIHSISLGEAFKQAFFERLEDEYDLQIAREALDEYERDGRKSRPIEELWEECGL